MQDDPKFVRVFVVLIGLMCLGLMGVGLFIAGENGERLTAFSATTTATVLNTRIEIHQAEAGGGDTATYHRPLVEYRYQVAGKEFTGDRIFPQRFQVGGNLGRMFARATLDRFEVDQEVRLYYDPDLPERSCLIRRPSLWAYGFALLPTAMLSVVFAAFWPGSAPKSEYAKRGKAVIIAMVWYAIGVAAAAHYLYLAGSHYSGGFLLSFGIYFQLGMIPLAISLGSSKSSALAKRVQGAVFGSVLGTFLGFWLGLGIAVAVSYFSGSTAFGLRCWGYTILGLAALLALSTTVVDSGDKGKVDGSRRTPKGRETGSPPSGPGY